MNIAPLKCLEMLPGGGNCCIFKFQICFPPKLNLQILFPSQKLSSPGKKNNQFPPQANQIPNFHSSPEVWGGMTLWIKLSYSGFRKCTIWISLDSFIVLKISLKVRNWGKISVFSGENFANVIFKPKFLDKFILIWYFLA